ncbi:hypothetical protein HDR60_04305 [bacterium]|nr:hypothetical protein [bacterium]
MKVFLCLFMLFSFNAFAQESRFSGKDLPRFSALKSDKVNARVGPNVKYPLKYIYVKKFLPVIVVNEYYGWYQIRDMNGDLSWVHRDNFTSKDYAMIKSNEVFLYKKAKLNSKVLAKINKGIIFLVDECEVKFCKVKTNYNGKKFEGYILKSELYGVN